MSQFGKEVGMPQPLLRQILHAAEGKKMANIVQVALASKDNNPHRQHRVDQKRICRTADLHRCAKTPKSSIESLYRILQKMQRGYKNAWQKHSLHRYTATSLQ